MSVLLVGAILGVVILAVFVWWLLMLVEALKIPSSSWSRAGQSQLLYVLGMFILGPLGTLLYVAIPRSRLRSLGPIAHDPA